MLASLLSKPQPSLSMQAKRLVAMRFLIYTGFQTSYFIGVIGTLTYADDASVVATSLAVLFMNVFVMGLRTISWTVTRPFPARRETRPACGHRAHRCASPYCIGRSSPRAPR